MDREALQHVEPLAAAMPATVPYWPGLAISFGRNGRAGCMSGYHETDGDDDDNSETDNNDDAASLPHSQGTHHADDARAESAWAKERPHEASNLELWRRC